jgi:two-component system, OmpR family, response regulator
MQKATILSVDDDESLQIVVRQHLEDDGYNVIDAMTGAEVMQKIGAQPVDVILLDLMLPDAQGFGLLARIKAQVKTPIIIVSGKSDTTEKIVGLEMGADDYITKPFELRELSARIRAVMRRNENSGVPAQQQQAAPANADKPKDKIVFSGWTLDRLQYQMFDAKGNSAELTAGEFKLLEALVLSPGRVLTRDYLFELTRESEFEAFDRAIDIQIGRLRKKLNDDPKESQYIKTVRGVGYLFCGKIDE